jgi:multiple sugar transport system ATP-binding protein
MDVRVEGLVKRYGRVTALAGVGIGFASGGLTAILGPSGCGKTTLLRSLAGFVSVDGGRIWFGQDDVTDLSPQARGTAMVFQNYALWPHMTIFENVAYGLRLRRRPEAEIRTRVEKVLNRVEIGHLEGVMHRKPAELSGGQQQRVALARALVVEPRVLLMDEPLSNLDAQLRVQTRTELKRLQQELGTTTLYVTHDQGEAMTLGSRVALLRGGLVEQVGPPLELYRRPATRFVAAFLGSPAMSFVPATRVNGSLEVAGLRIAAPRQVPPGTSMEAGLRPEDVELALSARPGFAPARALTAEPMGNETIVSLDADGVRLVARAGPDFQVPPGAPVFFRPVPERVHLFDTATGRRISDGH